MKRECDRIGDAIWEHVRFSTKLTDDAQRHIAQCPECARTMVESGRLSGLMHTAARVPDAPDCTSAVMSRISALPVKRPVWAYAAGLLAVLVISGLLVFHPHGTAPQVARNTPRPEVVLPSHAPTPGVLPAQRPMPEHVMPRPAPERRVALVKHLVHRHAQRVTPVPVRVHQPEKMPSPEQVARVPDLAAAGRRPVAAVTATWTAVPSQNDSYAYRQTDQATGESTTCTVKKSPGSVSIFMESKPSGEGPPSKGV